MVSDPDACEFDEFLVCLSARVIRYQCREITPGAGTVQERYPGLSVERGDLFARENGQGNTLDYH